MERTLKEYDYIVHFLLYSFPKCYLVLLKRDTKQPVPCWVIVSERFPNLNRQTQAKKQWEQDLLLLLPLLHFCISVSNRVVDEVVQRYHQTDQVRQVVGWRWSHTVAPVNLAPTFQCHPPAPLHTVPQSLCLSRGITTSCVCIGGWG